MAVSGPGLARICGLLVDGLIVFAKRFSGDFAAYQPLRSQHSPVLAVILCLYFNHGLPPFSILFGRKIYMQLQVLEMV